MLYILECMFYAFTTMHGGNNKPLMTTGKAMTINDVGVCLLGWWIVLLLVIFIRYYIAYAIRRHKEKRVIQAQIFIMQRVNFGAKKVFGVAYCIYLNVLHCRLNVYSTVKMSRSTQLEKVLLQKK